MFNVSLSVAYLVSFHEWWLMCFLQCTSFTPKHKDPRLNELHIKLSEKNQVFSSPPTPNSIVLWWPSTTKEYRYNDSNAVLGALYCNIHSFLTRLFIILKRTLLYKANTLYILEHSILIKRWRDTTNCGALVTLQMIMQGHGWYVIQRSSDIWVN